MQLNLGLFGNPQLHADLDIVVVNLVEHKQQSRHDDQVWPYVAKMLPEQEDNQACRDQGPDQIDRGLAQPVSLAMSKPVNDHPGLRKRK